MGRAFVCITYDQPFSGAIALEVFEVVVRARQFGLRIAVKQPRAPAASDLAEVPDGALQRSRLRGVALHRGEHSVEAAPHEASGGLVLVAQRVGRGVDPGISAFDLGPQRGRALQGPIEQALQTCQWRGAGPLFSPTRCRLSQTASSRPLSRSPAASSGARPSSVSALRTAAQ